MKSILAIIGGIVVIFGAFLVLPMKINQFSDELPTLREKWLNATQWTGMYSSYPEGIVNMAELDLSWKSDAIIYLEYSEESHAIDGHLRSDMACFGQMVLWNHYGLLDGSPDIWAPNRLILDVFNIANGHTVILDTIRIDREVPGGIITLRSLKSNGHIFKETLRLAPNPEPYEEDLDVHCLDLGLEKEQTIPKR